MELRYRELIGKEVLGPDGQPIGRIADLLAETRGDTLQVTALLIGPRSLVRRIGPGTTRLPGLRGRQIAWALVARIEQRIHLWLVPSEQDVEDGAVASSGD